jgi:ribosomal protein L11 methyltransferase
MLMIELRCPTADAELAAGLLWAGGIAGLEQRDASDATTLLRAGVDPEAVDDALAMVGDRWEVAIVEDDPEEWKSAWRPYARAVPLSNGLVLWPPWVEYEAAPGATVLELEPLDAWGHGAHPTTVLCAERLLRHPLLGRSVADLGCGSGALTLVAASQGATVSACDIDPIAVTATRENAQRNGLARSVDVHLGSVEVLDGQFDVLVANIGRSVICAMATALLDRVAVGGVAVLSGFFEEGAADVAAAFAALGAHEADRQLLDGWVSLCIARDR